MRDFKFEDKATMVDALLDHVAAALARKKPHQFARIIDEITGEHLFVYVARGSEGRINDLCRSIGRWESGHGEELGRTSHFSTTNEGAAGMDSIERLALAAEHLLAELGVTEHGAGQSNHEMPVAGMMDALYTAWNNYMRAKHGQADAIFEPEGA